MYLPNVKTDWDQTLTLVSGTTKTSQAIRPVQTAVKLRRTYSYSHHHAAGRSSAPPG